MTTLEERAPALDHTDWLLGQLADTLGRAARLAAELAATIAPPEVALGAPCRDVAATMPIHEVPVDGSVEVRGVTSGGRWGPWGHVIGEQQTAVGGQANRSLFIDGLVGTWTWHRDAYVQVRPHRPVDDDLAEAVHRSRNGGL